MNPATDSPSVSRLSPAATDGFFADANIRRRHPAEAAAWLWLDSDLPEKAVFARFSLEFEWDSSTPLRFYVTADQRFHLYLDGREIAVGPDRCDLAHWSVARYEAEAGSGRHLFEALVWWLPDAPVSPDAPAAEAGWRPMGQPSWRPGFLLAGEGADAERLSTGCAPWRICDLTDAVRTRRVRFPSYHDIGPSFQIMAESWFADRPAQTPVAIIPPLVPNETGVVRPGWKLAATDLPEAQRESWQGGRIRAVQAGDGGGRWCDTPAGHWQNLAGGREGLELAAGSTVAALWDLEDYLCGWPLLTVSGGRGAHVSWEWAEALYEAERAEDIRADTPKGRRDEIGGKIFMGFGDSWLCDGAESRVLPSFWWRAGRYVRIVFRTESEPLRVEHLGIRTTRFPLRRESEISLSDPALESAVPLMLRTLEASAHDCWTDSPYYEQMSYVGDNLLEALTQYTVCRDSRLTRRAIEMFDWSRAENGLVAERYPGSWTQVSATYAMLWPVMLRNHAWWRDDTAFIEARLPGMRCLVENLLQFRRRDGLLGRLPGWSFVDWVPDWENGVPPGAAGGESSIVNLQFLLCLEAAAQMEAVFGEAAWTSRLRSLCAETGAVIRSRFPRNDDGLIADQPGGTSYSEHAQALALLADLFSGVEAEALVSALREKHDMLAPATVYFCFYVLEALAKSGEGAAMLERLELWRGFADLGLLTVPEMPEPTRSDCHGWSAHPYFHFFASLAGIRPAAPGFRVVRVAPAPGALPRLTGRLPHPRGEILFDLDFSGDGTRGSMTLPGGISGEYHDPTGAPPVWLDPGLTHLSIAAP